MPKRFHGHGPEFDRELYEAALDLCKDNEFVHALPLALVLTANGSRNCRFPFLAGTCLQRLGMPAEAGAFFETAAALDEKFDVTVAAQYRLGECLQALQIPDAATAAFEKTIDFARSDERHRHFQMLAEARLATLSAGTSSI